MQAELVFEARNAVGESPVWSVAEQALYWVDITQRNLWRWDAASCRTAQWRAREMPACLAPRAQGGWVCGMESGIFALALQDDLAQPTLLAAVDHARPGMRFNDGRCDRQGRLRAGTMLIDMGAAQPVGVLLGLEEHGALRVLEKGLLTPNGLAFSPDGRTMYLSDSHPRSRLVWAYDYDTDTGTPHRKRVFADLNTLPGRPDGAAVDEDGCYWVCGNDAGLVHRFTPEGRLDRSLPLPVKKPAMCAFGGARLDTLFVTSIRPEGVDLSEQPLAGGLFAFQPGVRGLPEPACIH
jgi:sugar lactone lactonase YvrE